MAMKPAGKFVLILLILGVIIGGLMFARSKRDVLAPKGNVAGSGDIPKGVFGKVKKSDKVAIGVVTWGGYAGGQYYNRGFNINQSSKYLTDQGIKVEFKIIDDFKQSRDAFLADEVNFLWGTVDAITTEISGLIKQSGGIKIAFQADWSQGGDAFVVGPGISTVTDLIGKKVAFAEMTPSHTFLLYALDASDLQISDIQTVVVADAIEAAKLFREGQVDAAVVWSPDDEDCVKKVSGSKILMSTKDAPFIIPDVFMVKTTYLQANREVVKKVMRGFFIGAAEINSSDQTKRAAAQVLSNGFGADFDEAFCYNAINNARLCTFQDNMQFFGLESHSGMTGERIYNRMAKVYKSINYIRDPVPTWSEITDVSLLQELQGEFASDVQQAAQPKQAYTAPSKQDYTKEAVTTKAIRVTFATGSAELSENAKEIIRYKFEDIALASANRIRIEGNTDNTGSRATNISLSKKRANSCKSFLVNELSIDPNRIIVKGNGPDNPVADNDTDKGRGKNRRVDFMLLGD